MYSAKRLAAFQVANHTGLSVATASRGSGFHSKVDSYVKCQAVRQPGSPTTIMKINAKHSAVVLVAMYGLDAASNSISSPTG